MAISIFRPLSRMFLAAILMLAVLPSCSQQKDPNRVRQLVSVAANQFIESLNGKKFETAKALLHPDAPEEWHENFNSMPVLAGFLENKYQQIKPEHTNVNMMLDRHEVPIFLYKISFIQGSVMQKNQVGMMTLVWRPSPDNPDKYLLIDVDK